MSPASSVDMILHGQTLPLVEEPRRLKPAYDPRREIRIGAALGGVLLLAVGGWAATTRLDAAVISQGVVRIDGSRQVVQAPAGGVISTVHVAEGAPVRAGQVLVEFSTADALAQERALAARTFGLQAEMARLNAELTGQKVVTAPPEFAALSPADRDLVMNALRMEQAQLDAQQALNSSEQGVMADRSAQIGHQIAGYRERISSSQRQRDLSKEELTAYQKLYDKGLATKPRLLALERSVAAIDGDTGAAASEIARLRSAAAEARLQLIQSRNERASQNADRLRTAQTELATVMPQWQAAAEQLRRTVIRAPFAGTVTALRTPDSGAVVQAGAPLLEVVPSRGALTIESTVSVSDANDLHPGQAAQVRLTALKGRLLPPLNGVVERVSADSQEDPKSGQPFYTASIRISAGEMNRVAKMGGVANGLRAGTPVEVVVPTRPRSALGFLLGPLLDRMNGAFAQQ